MNSVKNTWEYQHRTELIIISITVLLCSAALYMQIKGFYLTFIDTDDYMRVVRIREFFQNYNLCDNVVKRCNVPYGCSLHWTRFYDFFIIIPSYFLSFFTSSVNIAIDYVCFCISPIIRVAAAFVFFKMLCKNDVINHDNAFLCLVFFATQPLIISYGNFGRPDHHAFIVLFVMVFLSKYFEAARYGFRERYIGTGRLTAICLWISPETLIPLLLADGVAFIYALKQGKEERNNIFQFIFLKNIETLRCIEILLIFSYLASSYDTAKISEKFEIIVAMELMRYFFVHFKAVTNPVKTFLQFIWIPFCLLEFFILKRLLCVYYDEISIVHWGLYASATYFFWILQREKNNGKITFFEAICATAGIYVFLVTFPKFLFGMAADVTPYVKHIWLNRVNEMLSPFSTGSSLLYILHALFVLIATYSKLKEIYAGEYKEFPHKVFFWVLFSALSVVYLVFAAFSNRMLLYSSLFSLPLLVDLGMNKVYILLINRKIRIFLTAFMTIFYIVFAAAFSESEVECENNDNYLAGNVDKNSSDFEREEGKLEGKPYSKRELFEELDTISSIPTVIMAHSNDGPSILYYTKHCAIGAPYHRQQEGIISSYEVMEAPYDEEKIKKILSETGASYIFVRCQKGNKGKVNNENDLMLRNKSTAHDRTRYKQSLSNMILNGEIPNWLEKMSMSKNFEKEAIIVKIKEAEE